MKPQSSTSHARSRCRKPAFYSSRRRAAKTAISKHGSRHCCVNDKQGTFLDSPVASLQGTLSATFSEGVGTLIGPYKLIEQIGEGGFGVVFMAEQQQPIRRRVALKVLKAGMDTQQVVARFEAERQALALMEHVSIARVLDGGDDPLAGDPTSSWSSSRASPSPGTANEHQLTPRERLTLFMQSLPGRAARPSKRDHPPRPQTDQCPGHRLTTASQCPR